MALSLMKITYQLIVQSLNKICTLRQSFLFGAWAVWDCVWGLQMDVCVVIYYYITVQ